MAKTLPLLTRCEQASPTYSDFKNKHCALAKCKEARRFIHVPKGETMDTCITYNVLSPLSKLKNEESSKEEPVSSSM